VHSLKRWSVVVAFVCSAVAFATANAQSPPMVDDAHIPNFLVGGFLNHTFTQTGGSTPVSWDNFLFVSFEPDIPGSTNPPMNATFDPDTQLFS
jgi:hypothetical protein